MEEIWKPVLGFGDRYEVSSYGRVRSIWREIPVIIAGGIAPNGYRNVLLSRNGKVISRSVHSLVLESFVGPRPTGMQGCHRDGIKLNNGIENLRWDTPKANKEDSRRHGTIRGAHKGIDHHGAKLWDEAIWVIRAEPERRGVSEMLARAFGVSRKTVSNVRHGKIWQHA